MSDGVNWPLDEFTVNTDVDRQGRRSLTREEMFVLAWLIFNTKDRNYGDLMKETNLNLGQCETAIAGLIELGLIRWRQLP